MTAKKGAAHGSHNRPAWQSWMWQNDAACRGEDLVLFFGPDGERQPERDIRERKARAICARCPVLRQCQDYSVNSFEQHGLWGGLTTDERKSERRRRLRRGDSVRRAVGAVPSAEVEVVPREVAS